MKMEIEFSNIHTTTSLDKSYLSQHTLEDIVFYKHQGND